MSLSLQSYRNSGVKYGKCLSSLVILIYLGLIFGILFEKNIVIAAPENFNPNLGSTSDQKIDDDTFEQNDRIDSEVIDSEVIEEPVEPAPQVKPKTPSKTTEKVNTDQVNIATPIPTISNESSIKSGTVDIDLQNKSSNNPSLNASTLDLENLVIDFQIDFDNFGQTNSLIEPKVNFNLFNQDFRLDTGVNLFKQDTVETVNNIPIYLTWETAIGKTDLAITGGVDFFDRLSTLPRFSFKANRSIFSNVTETGKLKSLLVLSAEAQYQAYKFNAETLENEIDFWRFTPNIYWQIAPNLSLFTLGQYGNFNDGNQEFQSFSRLEKKLGSFSLAANLFTWSFEQDLSETSGYFSPTDFLVYNGELAWQGAMFDETLDCKLSAAYGKQSLESITDNAWTFKALCGLMLLDNVVLDLGYVYTNVRDRNTGDTSFGNQSITGALDIGL